jgi:hypothetical protein
VAVSDSAAFFLGREDLNALFAQGAIHNFPRSAVAYSAGVEAEKLVCHNRALTANPKTFLITSSQSVLVRADVAIE